ncbi:hypothetical protein B0B52_15910 [Polaromonas sp. A23]|nr:hypothetical protein B0B52_15910 [Polaromonas sp. A23]
MANSDRRSKRPERSKWPKWPKWPKWRIAKVVRRFFFARPVDLQQTSAAKIDRQVAMFSGAA